MGIFLIVAAFYALLFVAFTIYGGEGEAKAQQQSDDAASISDGALRVRHYTHGYWCIEEKRFGFWHMLTSPLSFNGSPHMSRKDFPLMLSKQQALEKAKYLSDPDKLAEFKKQGNEEWQKIQQRDSDINKSREEIINI